MNPSEITITGHFVPPSQEIITIPNVFVVVKRNYVMNLVERALKRFKMIEPFKITMIYETGCEK